MEVLYSISVLPLCSLLKLQHVQEPGDLSLALAELLLLLGNALVTNLNKNPHQG